MLEIEEGMTKATGARYFFVRTDKGVVASFKKSDIDSYILDTNSVELKPNDKPGSTWNWVGRQLYVPNGEAIQKFDKNLEALKQEEPSASTNTVIVSREKLLEMRNFLNTLLA